MLDALLIHPKICRTLRKTPYDCKCIKAKESTSLFEMFLLRSAEISNNSSKVCSNLPLTAFLDDDDDIKTSLLKGLLMKAILYKGTKLVTQYRSLYSCIQYQLITQMKANEITAMLFLLDLLACGGLKLKGLKGFSTSLSILEFTFVGVCVWFDASDIGTHTWVTVACLMFRAVRSDCTQQLWLCLSLTLIDTY